jgi:predicted nucleic acid-binding protein
VALRLIDSGVWIDFFRGADTPASRAVTELAQHPTGIAVTQPILLEVLAGASPVAARRIERVLGSFLVLDVDVSIDFHQALELYRAVRRDGHTVRSLFDCVIASVALRRGAELVHKDIDFDRIAAVAPDLKVRSLL